MNNKSQNRGESYLKMARTQMDYYERGMKIPSSRVGSDPLNYLHKAEQNLEAAEFYGSDTTAERTRLGELKRFHHFG